MMKTKVIEKTRRLIKEYPGTKRSNTSLLYAYYSIYHNTADLSKLKDDETVPSPETILRAKRFVIAAEKHKQTKTHV